MAFFPQNFYNSEASFAPLFRLLDDFDSYSRQGQSQNGRSCRAAIAFQPKFDVRELQNHFELHGELAGLKKEDVHIEFTDPTTLRIHGRVERAYNSGAAPAGLVEAPQTNGDAQPAEDARKSHQATVEDEAGEETESGSTTSTSVQQTPQTSPILEKKQPRDRAKFWVTERSIGEFSRTFSFPGQIQQDAVTASLNEGILTIKVPKAPKHEARRISIL